MIRFRTARANIDVSHEKVAELLDWLRTCEDGASAADAIDNAPDTGVVFTLDEKRVVAREVGRRLYAPNAFEQIGPELRALSNALGEDIEDEERQVGS